MYKIFTYKHPVFLILNSFTRYNLYSLKLLLLKACHLKQMIQGYSIYFRTFISYYSKRRDKGWEIYRIVMGYVLFSYSQFGRARFIVKLFTLVIWHGWIKNQNGLHGWGEMLHMYFFYYNTYNNKKSYELLSRRVRYCLDCVLCETRNFVFRLSVSPSVLFLQTQYFRNKFLQICQKCPDQRLRWWHCGGQGHCVVLKKNLVHAVSREDKVWLWPYFTLVTLIFGTHLETVLMV